MPMQHVDGENKGKLVLYALSTCGWCKKTRMLLEESGTEYEYIYVDLLEDDELKEIVEQIKKWNPSLSFPTLVVNDEIAIVGFKEDEIRRVIK
jgi:glutaredoxin